LEDRNDYVSERKSAATVCGVSGVQEPRACSPKRGLLMKNRLFVPRLMRRMKRAFLIVLAAVLLGIVAVPAVSFADAQDDVGALYLDRPLDGVGDSPLVP
jgi:hypothetical protein